MSLKNLFSLQTVVSVLIALVLYDMIVKGLIGGLFSKSAYDDTLDNLDRDHFEAETKVRKIQRENLIKRFAA